MKGDFDMFIDKKLEKFGYVLIEENKYGASYEREVLEYGYVECVDIRHKASGDHLIQCYDKQVIEVGGDYFNSVSGIYLKALLWFWFKYIRLKIKYKWE